MDYKKILYSEISFEPDTIQPQSQKEQPQKYQQQNQLKKLIHTDAHQNGNSESLNFQAPKHQLSDPSLVKLNWLQSEKVGGGLINVGNTCFLNSVLQCLTYCAPLYNFLVKNDGGHARQCKLNGFCMLCEMEKLIKKIRQSTGTSIKPVSIVQRLNYINKTFQYGRQEDAHEFLRYLIDHMWKACLMNLNVSPKIDARIRETTIINHIFGGYHRSQVHCLTCNSRSDTYDFFMEFILDIRNSKSLEEALKRFTQAERLENENAYKCSNCRKKVAAKKKFTVFKAPNVATFHLKRFDSDRIFGGKITKFISYPEDLDLRPFMSEPGKSPIMYQLSAVLVHLGHSSNSGHYFCFIKNSNNFWYRMDDSNVTLVSAKNVLDQQAYVLFYVRRQINKPPLTTWSGSRSTLEDENETSKTTNRDRFNEELDQGKKKKIKMEQRMAGVNGNHDNGTVNFSFSNGNHFTTGSNYHHHNGHHNHHNNKHNHNKNNGNNPFKRRRKDHHHHKFNNNKY